MTKIISFIIFFLLFQSISFAQGENEELDNLALTSLLIKDGHLDRAQKTFAAITQDEIAADPKRYHTLSGLLALASSDFKRAKEQLLLAQKLGQKDQELLIYLSQAYYGLSDFKGVIATLTSSDQLLRSRPKLYLLLANSHWSLNDREQALQVLQTAMINSPYENEIKKQYFNYFIELGLYQTALEEILEKASDRIWSVYELKTFAAAFLVKNRSEEAKKILTATLLIFPENAEVTRDLAGLMAREKSYYVGAILFDQILTKNSKYSNEASELYRLSGHPLRALHLNTLILDQKEKLKQRLALYLEGGDFEKAITMESGLTITGLLEREEIRYALAYAFYKTRNFSKTRSHLNLITDERLFAKAIGLRANIEKCQENIWACE